MFFDNKPNVKNVFFKNTGSKYKVIYDLQNFPLKKNEGGLYSVLPYEKLDKHGKALFKVGLADSFDKRFEAYHTYYPLGFYYKNLLASPNKLKEDFKVRAIGKDGKRPSPDDREKGRKSSMIKYYKNIENYIFKDIQKLGGERLKTTTRIRNADENGGDSEWFYTNEKTLDTAFDDAFKIYGGKSYKGHLDDINKTANKNKKNATYSAEIHYKIYSK